MISIIIPAHNLGSKGDYSIKRCLDSILEQTYKDYEVLIIENGSTDDTINVIKDYVAKNNRIKLYHSEKGTSYARNKGLELSAGKYIMFIDGDDFISKDYLEAAFEIIESSLDIDFVRLNLSFFYKKNNKIKPVTIFEQKVFTPDETTIGGMSGKLIKLETVQNNHIKFQTNLTHGEDYLFAYHLYLVSKKAATTNKGMYYYVQGRKGQATKDIKNVLSKEIAGLDALANLFKQFNIIEEKQAYIDEVFVSQFVGFNFGDTRASKMSLNMIKNEVDLFKDRILNTDINDNKYIPVWKKIWFKRFQNAVQKGYGAVFLKFMRIYRNIFVKPFNIKWYK